MGKSSFILLVLAVLLLAVLVLAGSTSPTPNPDITVPAEGLKMFLRILGLMQ